MAMRLLAAVGTMVGKHSTSQGQCLSARNAMGEVPDTSGEEKSKEEKRSNGGGRRLHHQQWGEKQRLDLVKLHLYD
jgi:hypothetical protein